jgi:hypothetical protein
MSSKLTKSCLILVTSLLLAFVSRVSAEVDWQIVNTLKTEAEPTDVVVSLDGRSIFVLTVGGNVLIYDNDGQLKDRLEIGPHVDRITVDPQGEQLFATSRRNKTVEIIDLSFVYQIDTAGSPYKGPKDAPVVIAVFSDFQ